jgi:alanine-glyoxylate transaminase/serine-glyoxylate transaminase/serine-pyruvate transaminase
MPLHFGQQLLSIPGPSVMPERVLNAMHRASPNIYEGELIDIVDSIIPDLKTLACTTSDVAIYISNGHGAWEAALSNTVSEGDKVLVIGTGMFAIRWGGLGETLGLEIETLDFGKQSDADPDKVAEYLKDDPKHEIKAVLMVQTDTSSSVSNDVDAVGRAIRSVGHPALFMVDCIASLGTEEFLMDEWNVDVMVAACQKGLMVPAGMSFVYIGERAKEARKAKKRVSAYWDWTDRIDAGRFRDIFGGTAPTHHIFGLREALNMLIHEEGLHQAWARHKVFASAVWAAVDAWGAAGRMHLNIANPDKRSPAVTAITTASGDAGKLRKWTEEVAGVTLGVGLGMADARTPEYGNYFRIGHMGHVSVPMVMGTLGAIDAGLKANNIEHGPGALAVASAMIAQG